MKPHIIHHLIILSLILLSPYAFCQSKVEHISKSFAYNFEQYSAQSSPEKLYLHTDKEIYSIGETIWIKGYLQNKSSLSELPESRYIYVDLFSSDSLVSRIKLKHTSSLGFQGSIEIPYSLPTGYYTLRGYSRWMTAFPIDFSFHKQLHIVGSKGEDRTIDIGQQNTLAELTFFPESGRYLNNIPATIAFKANDKLGRGVDITGQLFESDGNLITKFSTSHAGMGAIQFTPKQGKHYYTLVKDNFNKELKVNLPAVTNSAAVINLTRSQTKLNLHCHVSDDLLSKNLMLIIHNGSQLLHTSMLVQSLTQRLLIENELEPGINHILVVDSSGSIYAERMFFVYPPFEATSELYTKKNEYGKREKVEVELVIKDGKGQPIEGEFSLAVTDFFTVPRNPYIEILPSYLLMSSELKGAIEMPGFYFSQAVEKTQREQAVDLLMIIQGWRYYDMSNILAGKANSVKQTKEYDQQISGKVATVEGPFLSKKNISVSIAAPDLNLYLSETLDGSKNFLINGLDFPDSTLFMLSGSSKKTREMNLNVIVDKPTFPKPTKTQYMPLREGERTLNWREAMDDYQELADYLYKNANPEENYLMEEARVFANYIYRPRFNPSPHNDTFLKSQIRERKDLEFFDDMMLSTYIQTRFRVNVTKRPNTPEEYGMGELANPSPKTIVIIDFGQPENQIEHMRVGDVETLVVLKGYDPKTILYDRSGAPVVMITSRRTHNGDKANTPRVTFYMPLGWQEPTQFYSPNYGLKEDMQNIPIDLRTTLFWEPMLTTDENGKAKVTFYTADRTTRFRFVLEGIADNGTYVSTVNVLE